MNYLSRNTCFTRKKVYNDYMKIYVGGAEGYTCQIDRIREGFTKLGHELTRYHWDADLIFINNPPFADNLLDSRGVKIYNVLDIPEHLFPFFDVTSLKNQLVNADAITSISLFTAKQVRTYLDLDSTVIYNPMKPVDELPADKKELLYDFLYVGRANDRNKRFYLVKDALTALGVDQKNLAVCGNENPMFGDYQAVVTDFELNRLYNGAQFVMLPSKIEGIGLSAVEGAVCGVVPVCCSDNYTAQEFFPYIDFPNPDGESIARFIVEEAKTGKIRSQLSEHKHELIDKFSSIRVAERILGIYENIKRSKKL